MISLATLRRKTDTELRGLVYSLTPLEQQAGLRGWQQPATLGGVVLVAVIALNIIFW